MLILGTGSWVLDVALGASGTAQGNTQQEPRECLKPTLPMNTSGCNPQPHGPLQPSSILHFGGGQSTADPSPRGFQWPHGSMKRPQSLSSSLCCPRPPPMAHKWCMVQWGPCVPPACAPPACAGERAGMRHVESGAAKAPCRGKQARGPQGNRDTGRGGQVPLGTKSPLCAAGCSEPRAGGGQLDTPLQMGRAGSFLLKRLGPRLCCVFVVQ